MSLIEELDKYLKNRLKIVIFVEEVFYIESGTLRINMGYIVNLYKVYKKNTNIGTIPYEKLFDYFNEHITPIVNKYNIKEFYYTIRGHEKYRFKYNSKTRKYKFIT